MNDLSAKPAQLWRWTIDTETGRVTDEKIDERFADSPKVDDRRVGLKSRCGYAVSFEDAESPKLSNGVIKYDLDRLTSETHDLGAHCIGQEPSFAPKSPDSPEAEGFVMVFSYDEAEDSSSLVSIDAEDFTGAPVDKIKLPQRVPFGAHGNWMPNA
jgi:carotenoid cleavage dioxygenase-like enzyme